MFKNKMMNRLLLLLLLVIVSACSSKQKTNPQEVKDSVVKMAKALQTNDVNAFIETANQQSIIDNCTNKMKNKPNEKQLIDECVKDVIKFVQSEFDTAINKKLIPYSAKFEIMETKESNDGLIPTRVKISYANKGEAFITKDGKVCKEAVVDFNYSELGKGMIPVRTDSVGLLSEYN